MTPKKKSVKWKSIKAWAVINPDSENPQPTSDMWYDSSKSPIPHGYFFQVFWLREAAVMRREIINEENRKYYKIIPILLTFPSKKINKK